MSMQNYTTTKRIKNRIMTLKEKFGEEPININLYNFKLTVDSAEKLEKIADEFAIGFAEWVNENYEYYHGDGEYHSASKNKWYKAKELLEIYKKEKGL
jgi:hypothetical protein